MMTGFGKVVDFTADEIILIHDLYEVAVKAKQDCATIRQKYRCFGMGEQSIEVWQDRDGYNFEYLTRDGVWQARYLHQKYDIAITEESLYELYKKALMVTKGYIRLDFNNNDFERECIEAELISRYFNNFVERTKRKDQ